MRIAKYFHETIFELRTEEYNVLLSKFEDNKNFECEDKQLFIVNHNDETYTAIDNRSGDFFHEDFTIEEDAYIWLLDLKCAEVLWRAENKGLEEWW